MEALHYALLWCESLLGKWRRWRWCRRWRSRRGREGVGGVGGGAGGKAWKEEEVGYERGSGKRTRVIEESRRGEKEKKEIANAR